MTAHLHSATAGFGQERRPPAIDAVGDSSSMRICFIVGSLEPGRDGVGDYTRRLAAECIRQNYPSIIVGFNDSHVSEPLFGPQEMEGTSISVLRLPSKMPWNNRMMIARQWIDTFNPDWMSLQFVPFGFHPKGLCFFLGKRLARLTSKASWHIMFHELWLGLGDKASVRHRIWGALQRSITLNLVACLRPQTVHTQTGSYQKVLKRQGVEASILPLYGNIPYAQGDAWDDLLEPLVTKVMGCRHDRTALYLAGVFGSIHPEWDPELAVETMLPMVQRFQKRLVLVFHGKSHVTPEQLEQLKYTLKSRAVVISTGVMTDMEISKILQTLDIGLATSPRRLIQKSGSVAAMLEHGLPVLVTRDDWHLPGQDCALEQTSSRLFSIEKFAHLDVLPKRDVRPLQERRVKYVADKLIKTMSLRFK